MTAPPIDDFYSEPIELGGVQPPTGNYERYILPEGDGESTGSKEYIRTTTISDSLDSGYGLGVWKLRRVAWAVAQRDDLIALLRACTVDDKDAIKEVVKVAETVGRIEEGANLGTAAHAVLQRVDQGEDIGTIHPYFHPVVHNYRAALLTAGLRVVPNLIERVCRNERYGTAGRFDNVYEEIELGTLVIGDKKTWGDPDKDQLGTEIQLALYANSDCLMNYDTGRYEQMPDVRKDYAVVVHINMETFEVRILRCDIECGWAAARVAMEQRELRRRKHVLHDYSPNFVKPLTQAQVIANAITPEGRAAPNAFASGVASVQALRREANGRAPATYDPSAQSAQIGSKLAAAAYCPDCDHDTHICKGCGASLVHGEQACRACLAAAAQARPVEGLAPTPQVATERAPQPTPEVTPAVDPATRVDEILDIRKNDKARLQSWAKHLGCTDLSHHRKWLADWIVAATPGSGAVEPDSASKSRPQTMAQAGLPPAPASPPGQPVIVPGVTDITQDQTLRDINAAPSLDALGVIWRRWTEAYGPASWTGEVEAAGNLRAAQIRATPPPGDDGPPF